MTHNQPVGDWTFGANLGYFQGGEDGSELDNKTCSGLFSAKIGGHGFFVGLQKISGGTG